MMNRVRLQSVAAVVVLTVCLLGARPIAAQLSVDADPGSSIRTRADLEGLLQSYEQVLLSPAYSNAVKRDVQSRSDRIRDRLTNGDFKLGDRVVLYVEGEPELPDTVPVVSSPKGPKISLPLFGDIQLAGVLRSEIEGALRTGLSQFIRNPVVRAEGLMRISVQGAVGSPGFYLVPANMLISETLMVAGGPGPNSKLADLRVERGSEEILGGEALQEELRQGKTLDQLNLQAGDQLFLPEGSAGGFFSNISVIIGLVSSLSFVVFQLAR
jgi:protein involved in polysaccharide export with SLBB domain